MQSPMRTLDDDSRYRGANHPDIANHHRQMNHILNTSAAHSPLYQHENQLESERSVMLQMTKGKNLSTRTQAMRQLQIRRKLEEANIEAWKQESARPVMRANQN
jgi:hypothetical protein